MNLISFLNSKDIDSSSIFALSVSTTGLNKKKDKVIAVSIQRMTEDSPTIIYVDVEDPAVLAASLEFNKIEEASYNESKHTSECAKNAIMETLKNCKLIVTYSFDHFMSPFLEASLNWKPSIPVLDVSAYAASLKKDEALFELPSSSTIEGYIKNLNRTTSLTKKEFAFINLLGLYCPCPELESLSYVVKRPVQLVQVFNNLALQ